MGEHEVVEGQALQTGIGKGTYWWFINFARLIKGAAFVAIDKDNPFICREWTRDWAKVFFPFRHMDFIENGLGISLYGEGK